MTTASPDVEILDAIELRSVSPIRFVREANNLSIRDAADAIGCHHQALYHNEIGCYSHILPVIMDWLVQNSDYKQGHLKLAYQRYQEHVRAKSKDLYNWAGVTLEHIGVPGDNPIIKFREHFDMSRAGLCKVLCLPTATLYAAENPDAGNLMAAVPVDLIHWLEWCGVSEEVLQEMVERYQVWYDNVR